MAASNNKMSAPYTIVAVMFDRPDPVYQAGEILAGWIDLNFKNDIRVKAMKVHIHGQARVSWDEKRTYTKGAAPTVSHKHSEVLLDHQVYLIRKDGNGAGNQQARKPHRKSLCFPLVPGSEEPEGVVIPAGPHRYSFEYILPRNLPSSFDGKWGYIVYSVKFTMDRAWKSTIERERPFTVDSVVDFNDEPELMRPIFGSGEFNVVTCCFAGEVYVEVRVMRKGFVRGDVIPVHVEIYNNSGNTMRDYRVSLLQHAIFRAGTRIKKTSTTLRTIGRGEIGPDDIKVWDLTLDVPTDVVPSTLKSDEWKGITVRYTITTSITPSWWSSNFVLPVQIIVGTIPLRRETAQRYLSHLMLAAGNSSTSLPITPKRRPDSRYDSQSRKGSNENVPDVTTLDVRRTNTIDPANIQSMHTAQKAACTRRLVHARQSAPCFMLVHNTPVPGQLGQGQQGQGRRASAFELGASPNVCGHQMRKSDDSLGNRDRLSSSLDTVTSSKMKMTVKEAKNRLKSVSEEGSVPGSTSTERSRDRSVSREDTVTSIDEQDEADNGQDDDDDNDDDDDDDEDDDV